MDDAELGNMLDVALTHFKEEELYNTTSELPTLIHDLDAFYVDPKEVYEDARTCFSYYENAYGNSGLVRIYYTPEKSDPRKVEFNIKAGLRTDYKTYNENVALYKKAVKTIEHNKEEIKKWTKKKEDKDKKQQDDKTGQSKKNKPSAGFRKENETIAASKQSANHALHHYLYPKKSHYLDVSTVDFKLYETLNTELDQKKVNLLGTSETQFKVALYPGNSIVANYDVKTKSDERANVFTVIRTDYPIDESTLTFKNDPMRIRIVLYLASLGYFCNYRFVPITLQGTNVFFVLNVDFRKPDEATCKKWAKAYHDGAFQELYDSVQEHIGKTFQFDPSSVLPSFESPLSEKEFKEIYSPNGKQKDTEAKPSKKKPTTQPANQLEQPAQIETLDVPFSSPTILQLLRVSPTTFWTLLQDEQQKTHVYVYTNQKRHPPKVVEVNLTQLCLLEGRVYGLNSDNHVCHIDAETFRITPFALNFHAILSSAHHLVGVVKNAEDEITHIVLYRGHFMNPIAVLSSKKGYYKTSSKVCEYKSLDWVNKLSSVVDMYENATHVYLLCPLYVVKYEHATSTFTRYAYKIVDEVVKDDAAALRKYKLRQTDAWFKQYTTREQQWAQYTNDTFNITKRNEIKAAIAKLESEQRNSAQENELDNLKWKLYRMTGENKPPEEEDRKLLYVLDEHTVVDGTTDDFRKFDDEMGNLTLQPLKSTCGQFTQKRIFTLQPQLQHYIDRYDALVNEAKKGRGKSGEKYVQLLLATIDDETHREMVRKALEEHIKLKNVLVKVEPVPEVKPAESEFKTEEQLPVQYYLDLYDTQKEQRANGQVVRGFSAEFQIKKISDPAYKKEVEQALQEHKAKLESSQHEKVQVKDEDEDKDKDEVQVNVVDQKSLPTINLTSLYAYKLKKQSLLEDIHTLLQKFKPIKIGPRSTDRERKEKLNSIHENLTLYQHTLNSTKSIPDETLSKISTMISELKSIAPKKGGARLDQQGYAHYFDHETRCLYECYFHQHKLIFKKVHFPISLFQPRKYHVRNTGTRGPKNILMHEDFVKLKEKKIIDTIPNTKHEINFSESKDQVQRDKRRDELMNELGKRGVVNENVYMALRDAKSELEKANFLKEAEEQYLKEFAEGKLTDATHEQEKRLVEEYYQLISESLQAIEFKTDENVLNLNRVRTHLNRDYQRLKGMLISYVERPPPLTATLKNMLALNNTPEVIKYTPERKTDIHKAMDDLGKEIQRKVYEIHDIDDEVVRNFPNSTIITTTNEILTFMKVRHYAIFEKHFKDLFDAEKLSKVKPLTIEQSKGRLIDIHETLQETKTYYKTFKRLLKEKEDLKKEKEELNDFWEKRTEFYEAAKKQEKAAEVVKKKETKKNIENQKQDAKEQIKEEVGESKVDKNSLLTNLAIFFGTPTGEEEIKYKESVLMPLFKAKYKDHATRMVRLKEEWTKFIDKKNLQRIKIETKAAKATKKHKDKDKHKNEAQKLTHEYKFLASSPQTKSENKEKGKGKGKETRKQAVRGRAATVPLTLAYLFCNEDPCYITERVENMLVPYEEGLKLEKATNVSTKETTKIQQDLAAILHNPNVLKAYVLLKYSKTTKEGLLLEEEEVFVPSQHPLDLGQNPSLLAKTTMLRRKIIFREELLYFVQLFQCNYDPDQSKSVYAFFPDGTQPSKQKLDQLITLAIDKAFHTKLHDAMAALRTDLDRQKTSMTFDDKVKLFLLECDKYNRLHKALHENELQFEMDENFETFEVEDVRSKLNYLFHGVDNAKRYILATYFKDKKEDKPKEWETKFLEKEFPPAWLPLVNRAIKEVFKQFNHFKQVTF